MRIVIEVQGGTVQDVAIEVRTDDVLAVPGVGLSRPARLRRSHASALWQRRECLDALCALEGQVAPGNPDQAVGSTQDQDEAITLAVTRRELATVLAALRFHQDENLQHGTGIWDEPTQEIATQGGLFDALSSEEIDALCERLSLGEEPVDWQVCEHDWQDSRGPMTGSGVERWFRCSRCGATRYCFTDQDGSSSEAVYPPQADSRASVCTGSA
jgi:hypothetical protein